MKLSDIKQLDLLTYRLNDKKKDKIDKEWAQVVAFLQKRWGLDVNLASTIT